MATDSNYSLYEATKAHLILTNLGKIHYKAKMERAHRSVPVKTQYVYQTIKEKHKGYVVSKMLASTHPVDPNTTRDASTSSSVTSDELQVPSSLNYFADDMVELLDGTERSAMFFQCIDPDRAPRESEGATSDSTYSFDSQDSLFHSVPPKNGQESGGALTDSDVLTDISSIHLVDKISSGESDVLSVVSSIHQKQNAGSAAEKSE